MFIDLTQRKVIVTAGGSGIGKEIALRFAAAGAQVAICDVDQNRLNETESEHPDLLCAKANVGDVAEIDAFFDLVLNRFGGLDVLVNNAGISGPTREVDKITPSEWVETVHVNLNGQFFCARRAIPVFKEQRSGVIINLSSAAGRLGMPKRAPYSASKYGVRGLTDALAIELGEFNIRVNAILPGLVDGERGRRVMAEQAEALGVTFEQFLPHVLHNISMHSMVTAGEIAELALFLASPAATHITGQSIGVCGNFESYRLPAVSR